MLNHDYGRCFNEYALAIHRLLAGVRVLSDGGEKNLALRRSRAVCRHGRARRR